MLTDPAGRRSRSACAGSTATRSRTEIVTVTATSSVPAAGVVGDGQITPRASTRCASSTTTRHRNRFGWITALRAPAIANSPRRRPLQMSCRARTWPRSAPRLPRGTVDRAQPRARSERTRKRADLLAATDKRSPASRPGHRGTLTGAGEIGKAVGKVINKHKMGKHSHHHTDTTPPTVRPGRIDAKPPGRPTCAHQRDATPSTRGIVKATRTSQHRTRLAHQDR